MRNFAEQNRTPLFTMYKFFLLFFLLLLLTACCKNKPSSPAASLDVPADSSAIVPDSTLYGIATDDFGMSTFAVCTDKGDSLELMRTQDDGTPAQFYGDIRPGDRYAFTVTGAGDVLAVAVNLTQVEACLQDYRMCNARLVLHPDTRPDTVAILHLDADSLVAKGRQKYAFPALKKRQRRVVPPSSRSATASRPADATTAASAPSAVVE